jgi:hypothetical protein
MDSTSVGKGDPEKPRVHAHANETLYSPDDHRHFPDCRTLSHFIPGQSYQGVYTGNKAVEMGDQGYKPSFFPSTLTVLPDGHSIIITSQLPNNVLTSVLRGSFAGNIFEGRTRARLNLAVYNYGTYYKIRFVGNEARIEKDLTINPPEGYVAPAKVQVFCKTHS